MLNIIGIARNKFIVYIVSLLAVAAIGYIDYITGRLSLSLFYLIPIALVAWSFGKWNGMLFAALSDCISLATDYAIDYAVKQSDLWNFFGRMGIYVIIAILISRVRELHEVERRAAREDFLTGIDNRRSFYELAELQIERAGISGNPVTIAFIDCDNFKSVNDALGHSEGDRLLKAVARTIKDHCRMVDCVARMGGDEFAVVFPDIDYGSAALVVKRIGDALLETMKRDNWPVTFSIGVATFKRPPESIDLLLNSADDLLYEVKKSGKNNIRHELL